MLGDWHGENKKITTMELKIVSFKVANALKEAGFPQKWEYLKYYYTTKGVITNDFYITTTEEIKCVAPTYLEVWLWLWREKGIRFDVED